MKPETVRLDREGSLTRYYFLDGLRGWAALIVMILHVFFGSLPFADFGFLRMDIWWSFNGNYMVGLFFVVSGFALSISYIRNGDRSLLVRMAAGRYFRLLIPIMATCILVSLFLNAGMFPAPADRTPTYAGHYGFAPTISHLVWFSFIGVFFDFSFAETYAGPLWTMSYELLASYALLFLLFVSPGRRWRVIAGVAISGYFLVTGSYYSLFFIGALAAEAYVVVNDRGLNNGRVVWMLGASLLVGGYVFTRFAPASTIVLLVSVSLWFCGTMLNPAMRAFMETPFSRFLGVISFPLYLIHEAMIVAVGMPVYVGADSAWGRALAGILAAAASLALAYAGTPVNKLAIVVSRRVGNAAALLLGQGGRRREPA
ncbi:MAG: acyltransferase [Mesorhizobium sp.]|nr:acyltransferase [Mesorhizobium sp.]MBN9244840.1 acyltransferase [Mesorhizobium sp.]